MTGGMARLTVGPERLQDPGALLACQIGRAHNTLTDDIDGQSNKAAKNICYSGSRQLPAGTAGCCWVLGAANRHLPVLYGPGCSTSAPCPLPRLRWQRLAWAATSTCPPCTGPLLLLQSQHQGPALISPRSWSPSRLFQLLHACPCQCGRGARRRGHGISQDQVQT